MSHKHAVPHLPLFTGGSVVDPGDLANMALATNSCYRYDFGSNFWTAIAPMRSARMYHSVAVLEGVIYAMGGESSVSMATEDHWSVSHSPGEVNRREVS